MDTLIGALIAVIGTLLAVWFTARVNKSTETKAVLLNKIDDWLNEEIQYIFYMIFTFGKIVEVDWKEMLKELCKLNTGRVVGIAKALKNEELNSQMGELKNKMSSYVKLNLDILDASEDDKVNITKEQFTLLYNNVKDIENVGIEIHRIIAEELMRVF